MFIPPPVLPDSTSHPSLSPTHSFTNSPLHSRPCSTCPSGDVCVQDFYEVAAPPSISQKITYAKAQLERSGCCSFDAGPVGQQQQVGGGKKEKNPLYVNFLSASNFWNVNTWPEKIAGVVNPSVVEHLCRGHMLEGVGGREGGPAGGKENEKVKPGDWSTGVVVCDWVGQGGDWDLVRCVVGMNARLVR